MKLFLESADFQQSVVWLKVWAWGKA